MEVINLIATLTAAAAGAWFGSYFSYKFSKKEQIRMADVNKHLEFSNLISIETITQLSHLDGYNGISREFVNRLNFFVESHKNQKILFHNNEINSISLKIINKLENLCAEIGKYTVINERGELSTKPRNLQTQNQKTAALEESTLIYEKSTVLARQFSEYLDLVKLKLLI